MRVLVREWGLFGLSLAVVLSGGCGGSGFGGDVRVPASEESTLTGGSVNAGPVSLPADRGFSIHIKRSSQDPGPAGTATSTADATAEGHAVCQAQTGNGGAASAEFNIGHRISNRSDDAQAATIELTYELEQAVGASPEPTAKTISTAQMLLVVLDSHKRSIASMTVVQATSDDTRATAADRDHRVVPVKLQAHESYDIMLFGQVQAKADAGQEASARIEVRQLTMRLSCSPATQPARP